MQIIDLRDSFFGAARGVQRNQTVALRITHGEGTIPLSEAMLLWEARLSVLATELGPRGPVPLALNQARTALAGAIGLVMLDDAMLTVQVGEQLFLAAGFCQRALKDGSAVGSG